MPRLLSVLAAFVGGTIVTYMVVLVGAFIFWSFVPTPDPTKIIAATVFLVVGPAVALAGGLWLAIWAGRGAAPWPVSAWVRGREIRRRRMAASAAIPVATTSGGERVIGWLFALLGGGGIALGLAAIALFWGDGDPRLKFPVLYLLPVFLLAIVGLLGPAFLGGIGLLLGRVWGRPVVTVTAILMLLLVPVGTVLGLAALIVLHGHRLRRRAPAAPQITPDDTCRPIACVHLAPVAQASMASGIPVTRRNGRLAEVHCTAYPPSLQRLMPTGSPVLFEEWPAPERSTLDPPRLAMRCTACDAALVFDAAAGPLMAAPRAPGS